MDPGTALGAVSLIYDVTKDLYEYYKTWSSCEKDVKDLRAQLLWLHIAAEQTRKTLGRPGLRGEDSSAVIKSLDSIEEAGQELKQMLEKVVKTEGKPTTALQKLTSKGLKEGRKALYPFKKSTISDMFDNVETCCEAFRDALTLLHLNLGATIAEKVDVLDDKIVAGHTDLTTALAKVEDELATGLRGIATNLQSLEIGSQNQTKELSQKMADHTATIVSKSQDTRTVLERRHDQTVSLLRTAEDEKKAQAIIDSLAYPEMDSRRQRVVDAHEATCEWIFEEANTQNVRLAQWLKSGDGIYWITGKPGSGKSTFMKFLVEHPRTGDLLEEWAGDEPCSVVSHYFWVAGTKMEQSYEGLLRSLLSQVLSAVPSLVPIACKKRWESRIPSKQWSTRDLLTCLLSAMSKFPHHAAFFIDGMDEFTPEGDHPTLLHALEKLQSYTHVKMIVSSRPWPVFERTLTDVENMTMEQVNRPDLTMYARNKLGETYGGAHFQNVSWECIEKWSDCRAGFQKRMSYGCGKNHHDSAHEFAMTLINKAGGVFLWLYMVLDRIVERLNAEATIDSTIKELDTLPGDLETYFRDLVYDRIHDTWKGSETAMAVFIILAIQNDNLDGFHLAHIYLLSQSRSSTGPSLLNPNFAYDTPTPTRPHTTDEMLSIIRQVVSFLNGCCRDLVQTPDVPTDDDYYTLAESLSNLLITFCHRSMFDFWKTPEMQDVLRARVPEHFLLPTFMPQFVLATTLCFWPSLLKGQSEWAPLTWLRYAFERVSPDVLPEDSSDGDNILKLGSYIEQTAISIARYCHDWCEPDDHWPINLGELCITFALGNRYELWRFLLHEMPLWLCGFAGGQDLGDITWPSMLPRVLLQKDFRLADVDALLQAGSDPNERLYDYDQEFVGTTWTLFLSAEDFKAVAHPDKEIREKETQATVSASRLARQFIQYGADLDALVPLSSIDLRYGSLRDAYLLYEDVHDRREMSTVREILQQRLPPPEGSTWSELIELHSTDAKREELREARKVRITNWPANLLSPSDRALLGLPYLGPYEWDPEIVRAEGQSVREEKEHAEAGSSEDDFSQSEEDVMDTEDGAMETDDDVVESDENTISLVRPL